MRAARSARITTSRRLRLPCTPQRTHAVRGKIAEHRVEDATEFAENAPDPEPDRLYANVYSEINPDGRLFFDDLGR